MEICSEHGGDIAYEDSMCPACEAINTLKDEISDLQSEIDNLKGEIEDLQDES